MAIRGGYDFAIFDSRFELLRYVKGVDTRFVKQGIDCGGSYGRRLFPQTRKRALGAAA